MDGNSYEGCTCDYYQNYCTLYETYADGYPEVAAKCAVSECCEGADTSEEEVACIPELMPSSKPSLGATKSYAPTLAVSSSRIDFTWRIYSI